MPAKFFPVTDSEKKQLFETLSAHLPAGYADPSFCKVLQARLPFYPEWQCFDIQKEADATAGSITLFKKNQEVVVLDWQSKTILEFNKTAPLMLSVDDIAAYVMFYFSHVRARDGRMHIISSYDDLNWREEPAPHVKKALASLIRAPHLMSWDEQNHSYEVGAHILLHNHLLECRLHVNRLGEIDVSERTLQVEDMPLLDDIAE